MQVRVESRSVNGDMSTVSTMTSPNCRDVCRVWRNPYPLIQSSTRNKFLDALRGIDLARIEVSFRIDRDLMDPVKLAGIASGASERAQRFA